MRKLLWALLAAVIHAVLFGLMWGVYWTQPDPFFHGASRWLFAFLFLVDIPISIPCWGAMWSESQHALTYALAAWGVLGTLWWFFLGYVILSRIAAAPSPQSPHPPAAD